jgi:hypothetical protein
MRIHARDLISAFGERARELRAVSASNIEHSDVRPLSPRQGLLHDAVDKTEAFPVAPQIFLQVGSPRDSL